MVYSIKLYTQIIAKEAQRFFTYRVNILSGCLTALFMLGARYALWAALFAAGNAGQSSLAETMTYFVICDIIMIWLASSYGNTIGEDIRSGDIAQKLIKPCSYHLMLVSSFHATSMTSTLTRALPMFIIAVIFIGLLPPASVVTLFVFLLSVILGAVIYSLIDLIISYTAFWLTDYWCLSWFKRALFVLFGGLALPLWFYPGWLYEVCKYLPFQYTIYTPLAVYLGRIPSGQVVFSIALQLLWICILFLLERIIWMYAKHKMTVQGG
ncbi:MAG: ABC-2 family transporter protein [Oscillospiraceae bacterium]|nr:ABC-2 family transporter protein [Oscillospiraceae bacterium]